MNYYRDKKTNEVWFYDDHQLSFVKRINEPGFDNKENSIPEIFFEINEKIKGMKIMTAEEIEAHINPPVTKEQQVAEAEAKKQMLVTEANQKTQMWQTQLMLGIITEEDKASLKEWMLYVQNIQAVDVFSAPDIDWPVKP
ncbi:tail fiber assembly protein [Morganella morganii]|uniref:tail fiber assembly protein n=1 Tax=Morganella morganii TaxID=582 RepID=UPI0034E55955